MGMDSYVPDAVEADSSSKYAAVAGAALLVGAGLAALATRSGRSFFKASEFEAKGVVSAKDLFKGEAGGFEQFLGPMNITKTVERNGDLSVRKLSDGMINPKQYAGIDFGMSQMKIGTGELGGVKVTGKIDDGWNATFKPVGGDEFDLKQVMKGGWLRRDSEIYLGEGKLTTWQPKLGVSNTLHITRADNPLQPLGMPAVFEKIELPVGGSERLVGQPLRTEIEANLTHPPVLLRNVFSRTDQRGNVLFYLPEGGWDRFRYNGKPIPEGTPFSLSRAQNGVLTYHPPDATSGAKAGDRAWPMVTNFNGNLSRTRALFDRYNDLPQVESGWESAVASLQKRAGRAPTTIELEATRLPTFKAIESK